MFVLGLTGSIGMGKSETAKMLRAKGVPVFSADEEVHRLTRPHGAALKAISGAFPGTVTNGVLDRQAIAKQVFDLKRDPERKNLRRLEAILHPRVRQAEERFLRRARIARKALAVLDIPLLLEGKDVDRVDAVLVVSAPANVQAARVLRRPGMNAAKLAAIRATQMPNVEKRRRADYLLPTGLNRRDTLSRLARLLAQLRPRRLRRSRKQAHA